MQSEALAARLDALADDVIRIRALHRHRPEVFLEDKSEVARHMRELAIDIRSAGRLPKRADQAYTPSAVIDRNGRSVRVERRFRA